MIKVTEDTVRVKEPEDMPKAFIRLNGKVYEARIVAAIAPGNLLIVLVAKDQYNWKPELVADEYLYDTSEEAELSNIEVLQREAAAAQKRLVDALMLQSRRAKAARSGKAMPSNKLPKSVRPSVITDDDDELAEEGMDEEDMDEEYDG
jgi:hypothetical protein